MGETLLQMSAWSRQVKTISIQISVFHSSPDFVTPTISGVYIVNVANRIVFTGMVQVRLYLFCSVLTIMLSRGYLRLLTPPAWLDIAGLAWLAHLTQCSMLTHFKPFFLSMLFPEKHLQCVCNWPLRTVWKWHLNISPVCQSHLIHI